MHHKGTSDVAKGNESRGGKCTNKHAGKTKNKKPSNPWVYEETLLIEHDKCSLTDLAMLNCRSNFEIKPLPEQYTEKSRDDDLYRIFGGLINQGVGFMRQQIRCFSLMHKGYIMNLTKTYLKGKSLKTSTWITGIKMGIDQTPLPYFY